MKKQNGITLIALIITVIVLLILAGVTISFILQGGLIGLSADAKIKARKATAEEIVKLNIFEVETNKMGKATLEDVLNEFKKEEETEIEVIGIYTGEIASISCEIPEGKVEEIVVVVDKYREFTFTIGEELKITKVCGIEYEEWDGETLGTPVKEKKTKITIEVTPSKQEGSYIEEQVVGIKVRSTKGWTEWEAKYAWTGDKKNEPAEEQWNNLTLNNGSTALEKIGQETGREEDEGEYYLWIKVRTVGVTKVESFGPYKIGANPTQDNLVLTLNTNTELTQGVVTVGSDKAFPGWTCVYQKNGGEEIEVEGGTTQEVGVVQGDEIIVRYKKEGKEDIIKTKDITELKQGYTIIYDANGGIAGPSNDVQYDNTSFTITSVTPTKAGYRFIGWKADGVETLYKAGDSITITIGTKLTLKAQYEQGYTIIYNVNGGSGGPSNETQFGNTSFTVASGEPTKTDSIFLGWKADGDETLYKAGDNITITSGTTLTLYAQYNTVTIGGSITSNKAEFTEGTVLTVSNVTSNYNITKVEVLLGDTVVYEENVTGKSYSKTLNIKEETDTTSSLSSMKNMDKLTFLGTYRPKVRITSEGITSTKQATSDVTNYTIGNRAGLDLLATKVNAASTTSFSGKTILQVANIDMKGTTTSNLFTGIGRFNGTNNKPFAGTYNGNNKQIQNLYINNSETTTIGLFGFATGTLKNIITESGGITQNTAGKAVGAVCGRFEGTSLSNCTNRMNLTVNVESAVGGIVGNVPGTATREVLDCVNEGNITGLKGVGGIAGNTEGTIRRCINKGDITSTMTTAFSDVGGAGGITSTLNSTGDIVLCYNSGTVKGKFRMIGGIVGLSQHSVRRCYNLGTVKNESTTRSGGTGGIVGESYSAINYCYNKGSVIVASTANNAYGSIVGNSAGSITKCYYLNGTANGSNYGHNAKNSAETINKPATNFTQPGTNSNSVTYLLNQGLRQANPTETTDTYAQSSSIQDGYPYLVNNPPR